MDWVAAVLNITGAWLLPRRRYAAMAVYALSSIVFAVWAATKGSSAIVLLQLVLLALNIRTVLIWRNDDKRKKDCSERDES